jgi:uncharacterized protein (DUF427 family)
MPMVQKVVNPHLRSQLAAKQDACQPGARKGEASYYSIAVGSCRESGAVWCYKSPLPGAQALAGYLAFRDNAVDAFDPSGKRLLARRVHKL